ncbi:MAG: UDP-N-acetylglucosamine 2-epimerase (non-hydrolyzing) [Chloroflexi bacterium]|nr:UDP-N-acetylglucosamine 2-epimerase (non-hydrolyzing) [Chloroflexota bacterium]
MSSLKVLSVLGTRPEAIKLAPVIHRLQETVGIEAPLCVTAQHRHMLDQVLHLFDLHPQHDLGLMQENQTLAGLTAAAVERLDPVLQVERPDWVLVQGDTTTVMAASLAAFYHHIRVGHVEAGLRTDDKYQPFPEEINRRVTSVVADLHFAPTEHARQNLLHEGIADDRIYVTGNTVIDALHLAAAMPFDWEHSPLAGLPRDSRLVLVTAHRRENFGAPLERICRALLSLAARFAPEVHFVYPVHLNPNVDGPVREMLSHAAGITLLPPLDYLPMVNLLKRSALVLTDSGGVQEEAPGLGKPVLVMREVTERPEGVAAGTVHLVGTDQAAIEREVTRLLTDGKAYAAMAQAVNPYGDGHAAERIVDALVRQTSASQG